MNQILTTKPVKRGKSVKIKTVKIFFGISIIIFGLGLITSGSLAIYTNMTSNKQEYEKIDNTIDTPSEQYKTIEITLSVNGENIEANVVGETEIAFVTYKWDNEEEQRKEINSVSDTIMIQIPEGQHTLTVTAVDINNNEETKVQEVKGIVKTEEGNTNETTDNTTTQTSKPKLNVTYDEATGEFVIDASDEKGLDKFEFILNGQGYRVRAEEGEKEKQFRYPLAEGDNKLEVTAYNIDGEKEQFNAMLRNYHN